MPVVTRNRTEELHFVQLAPRGTSHDAMGHSAGNRVIHHIQACIAVYDHILRFHAHDIRHHLLCLSQPVQHAVVADIHALYTCHIALGIQNVEDIHPHIQLSHRGLSSGHIQLQSFSFHVLIFFFQLCF